MIGNPTTGDVAGPAPVGAVPVPDAAPRGPSPQTHVYARSTGGQPREYVVAEFHLPPALAVRSLILTVADDGGSGENVSADTATLAACAVSTAVSPTEPNAPVSHDCATSVTGKRIATSSGGGWTFDLDSMASAVPPSGEFGVALVPSGPQLGTFSVSLIRASFTLAYQESPALMPEPVASLPAAPAPLITPSELQPTGDAGLHTRALEPAALPLIASSLTPQLAASDGLVSRPTASSGRQPNPTNWRPLLLLLVPAVPVAALAINRRLARDDDLLTELFPRPTESV